MLLAQYCFLEHGIFPSQIPDLVFEEKIICLTFLKEKAKKDKKDLASAKRGKGRRR